MAIPITPGVPSPWLRVGVWMCWLTHWNCRSSPVDHNIRLSILQWVGSWGCWRVCLNRDLRICGLLLKLFPLKYWSSNPRLEMDTHAGAFARPRRTPSALGWDVACRRRVHDSKSELVRSFGGETSARMSPAGGLDLRLGRCGQVGNLPGRASAINASVRSRPAHERRRCSPAAGRVSRRVPAACIWTVCSHTCQCG